MSYRQRVNHNMKYKNKKTRIEREFMHVKIPPGTKTVIHEKEILEKYIVFDGGDNGNQKIQCPPDLRKIWKRICVNDKRHLHVVMSDNHEKGLIHIAENDTPNFMLLSRKEAMEILPKKDLCNLSSAISACEKAKGSALIRGKGKMTFGDDVRRPPKYTSVGVQPHRAEPGVSPYPSFMTKTEPVDWNWITKMMRWSERAFKKMACHSALHHIQAAKDLVSFPTMRLSSSDDKPTPAKYFGAIAFGRNLHLRCHTDEDYTFSMIQVHLEGQDSYAINERVVAYFCFPTLGIAVALRPGDFLMFNPTVPHCLSSRCRNADNVISVSSYLKTAVVGLNDNSLPLTDDQEALRNSYYLMQKKDKMKTTTRKRKI